MDHPTDPTPPAPPTAPDPGAPEAREWQGTRFPAREKARRARRRSGRGGVGVREHLVQARLTDAGFDAVDTRSAQARLGVGAWLALLGEDVALGRPAFTVDQLRQLRDVTAAARRIGATLNALAVGENVGREAPDSQLAPVLARIDEVARRGVEVLDELAAQYESWVPPARTAHHDGAARGRREPHPGEGAGLRERRVSVRLSDSELGTIRRAAEAAGMSIGAWLGLLAEHAWASRPALNGEQWAGVTGLRKALRRLATNLTQIDQARAARGHDRHAGLADTRGAIDTAIRRALGVADAIGTAGVAR